MEQQTGVEWFYQRILAEDIKEVFKEAKSMEKQQIQMAYLAGSWTHPHPCRVIEAEIYYNSTFKK